MKILFAVFDSPEDFLDRLEVEGDGPGSIRVKTKAQYDPDEEIILEIGFPGLPNRILTRATAKGRAKKDESVFRFIDGEDDKRDFLVAVAAGCATASWKRRHRRFPVRLPARFVVEGEQDGDVPLRGDAEVEDMGSGGVSLKTARTLPDGARVTIVLDPLDGSPEIEFAGRVVWGRRDDAVSGVGIQFDKLGGEDMKRLRRMIRDVKLRGETTE